MCPKAVPHPPARSRKTSRMMRTSSPSWKFAGAWEISSGKVVGSVMTYIIRKTAVNFLLLKDSNRQYQTEQDDRQRKRRPRRPARLPPR